MKKIFFYFIVFSLWTGCTAKKPQDVSPTVEEDLQDSTYLHLVDMIYPSPQTAWQEQENRLLEYAIQENWPVRRDTSGYFYAILDHGSGERLKWADPIRLEYETILTDGSVADSSYKRGKPLNSYVGNLATGLNQALKHFSRGDRGCVLLPSYLAYGEEGIGSIPPNTPLIFKIYVIPN